MVVSGRVVKGIGHDLSWPCGRTQRGFQLPFLETPEGVATVGTLPPSAEHHLFASTDATCVRSACQRISPPCAVGLVGTVDVSAMARSKPPLLSGPSGQLQPILVFPAQERDDAVDLSTYSMEWTCQLPWPSPFTKFPCGYPSSAESIQTEASSPVPPYVTGCDFR